MRLDAELGQVPRGGGLDAEVEGGDREPLLPHRRDDVGLVGAHLRREVGAGHALGGGDLRQQRVGVGDLAADADPHRAAVAQVAGERAGVDAADPDDALPRPARRPGCRWPASWPGGGPGRGRRTRRPTCVRLSSSSPFTPVLPMCGAVMTTTWPVVAGVGQRLLVAGHPGGEDRLADRRPDRAVGLAPERPPVLEHEDRVCSTAAAFPSSTGRRPPQERRDHAAGELPAGVGAVAAAAGQRGRVDGGPGARGRAAAGWPARRGRAGGRGRRAGRWRRGAPTCGRRRPRQSSRPVSTIVSTTTESACSSPSIPGRAAAHSLSLSSTACGAWSVATASIVPSASPARSASTSSSVRSGGLTLNTGS